MKSVQSARTSPAPTVHESSMLNLKFFGAAAIISRGSGNIVYKHLLDTVETLVYCNI